MDSLISTQWLANELGAPDLRVVDATFFLPTENRDAQAEHVAAHIPGAVFFDIAEIADLDNPLPHMLPDETKFASRMQSLGIGDGNRIVIYDNSPLHTAARAWWMLKAFGAHHVAILDGGFQKWMAEGRPFEIGRDLHRHGHFTARLHANDVADKAQVLRALEASDHEIVDARPAARFAGEGPEPRPGLPPATCRGAQPAAVGIVQPRPQLQAARGAEGGVRQNRRRSFEADDRHLRLGRHRRLGAVRRTSPRQAGRARL